MSKPTLLWIHGSWHTPEHWALQLEVAKKAGYENECPRHPSVGNKPPLSLKDDAQCIRETLERLVEKEGKEVLVIAHSYGGMVANEGIDARFARAARKQAGKPGGVLRIVFLTAFLVTKGQALATPLGGALPPFIPVDDEQMCTMADPEGRFYNDLPEADQKRWASAMLKSPAATQLDPLTQDVYTSHPVTYVFCTNDQGLIMPAQQGMVQAVSQATGVDIPTESLDASHSPYISMPDKVLELVERQIQIAQAA